jgi:hypothetical protein
MYSQLLPRMAAERVGELRREAKASSLASRVTPARPRHHGHHGHHVGRRARAHGADVRLTPRAARS